MLTPYYEEENITIYHGDCLEVMPQLTQKFDAIIADLPYGTTECEWDSVIDLERVWGEYKRLTKNNSAIVLFSSEPFTSVLITSNINDFKYRWTWDKSRITNYLNSRKQPLRITEDIAVFYREQCVYNPQLRTREKKNIRNTDGAYSAINNATYGKTQEIWKYNSGREIPLENGYPVDLIRAVQVGTFGNKRLHPAQKPEDIMVYLIRTYTNEGDIILDNTMGSGTTLVAAKIEGRKAVGIELKEKYCQDAVQRLKEVNPFYQKPSKKKDTPYEGFDMEDWLKS